MPALENPVEAVGSTTQGMPGAAWQPTFSVSRKQGHIPHSSTMDERIIKARRQFVEASLVDLDWTLSLNDHIDAKPE